jgi:lysophospholipase L1-like esterase
MYDYAGAFSIIGKRRRRPSGGGGGAIAAGTEVFFGRISASSTLGNITIVNRLPATTFGSPPASGWTGAKLVAIGPVDQMFIGHQAAAGDVFDFGEAPTQVLFGGSGSITGSSDKYTESDLIPFVWDGTRNILVSLSHNAPVTYTNSSGIANVAGYFRAGAQEPALQNKSGYSTASGFIYTLQSLRLFGNNNPATTKEAARKIVCDGNSLTFGTGGTPVNLSAYPFQMTGLLRYGANTVNLGVPSATTAQRAAANDTLAQFSPGAVAVLWEGTNTLWFGGSAATAIADYAAWCAQVRAQGYKVVAVTVLPRTQAGVPPTFEADRQTVNSSIRANWASYADALADVGADALIGQPLASDNTTYYNADKVHMNATGYGVVASIVASAVSSLS